MLQLGNAQASESLSPKTAEFCTEELLRDESGAGPGPRARRGQLCSCPGGLEPCWECRVRGSLSLLPTHPRQGGDTAGLPGQGGDTLAAREVTLAAVTALSNRRGQGPG